MLIKVTAVIETIVQIKDGTSYTNACNEAKNIISENNFSCLQSDLQVSDTNDGIELFAEPILDRKKLPSVAKHWFAWEEDGGTTDQTCEEILRTK